ncbi:UPF0187-domain-containing protein [Sistotremastrum niveocremeum HHB9708]|uniref:UPF0187-domain-containing protein n=1 Tax=Sistotremastrum niveocremeum HHB9708 TaxID=1314777 RepID=A0A164SGH1_9AGAM|nr:UPF0187-domain-containing protein [Sistotremastrum niveocremeum HHB9708]
MKNVSIEVQKSPSLARTKTRATLRGTGHVVDPFATSSSFMPGLMHALLATALFRCWHLILFFAAWSSGIMWTVLTLKGVLNVTIQPTLLTVIGTVLGFVISYRTTSSFERYNEGRKYWSQIVLNSRTFARSAWFHIPDVLPATPEDEGRTPDEIKARILIEKKAAINLIEAFAVAVKHYLRNEEGIYYADLYPLVKFLPAYSLPAGLASIHHPEPASPETPQFPSGVQSGEATAHASAEILTTEKLPTLARRSTTQSTQELELPLPATTPNYNPKTPMSARFALGDDPVLLPARDPPKYSFFDLFPFSLVARCLTKRGVDVSGKKAAKLRAKLGLHKTDLISHNVPLEISLYLSSYIAALQNRKSIDVATTNQLLNSLNGLVDALTGLERILTTPIPFSYSIHLWVVTALYCLALPFQIIAPLRWLTIPGTVVAAFIFFGFLVAGEEIENPFGYDKNDLNLDHFTHTVIRQELQAITSMPMPDPARWAFSSLNDSLLQIGESGQKVTPNEWVQRGPAAMREQLGMFRG